MEKFKVITTMVRREPGATFDQKTDELSQALNEGYKIDRMDVSGDILIYILTHPDVKSTKKYEQQKEQ